MEVKKLFDLYIKEELLTQCDKHFAKYLDVEGSGYLTEKDYKLVEEQIDYLFQIMDEIIKEFKEKGEDDIEAYAKIIDQFCGYIVLGKMNEARLCNMLNDILDEKGK